MQGQVRNMEGRRRVVSELLCLLCLQSKGEAGSMQGAWGRTRGLAGGTGWG